MPDTRGLPIPPQSVMPPEGLAPVTQQIDTTGQDLMSPTVMIQNYLAERGFKPTQQNVSRAMMANARDPGVIRSTERSLVNEAPPEPDRTSAQPSKPQYGPPVGPPVNAINESVQQGDRPPGSGDVPPPTADSGNLGSWILGLLGVPGVAGARAAMGPQPGGAIPGNPPLALNPQTNAASVGPDMLAPPPAQLEAPPARLAAPVKQITGPAQANEAPVAEKGSVIARPDQSVSGAIDKAVEEPPNAPKPRVRVKAGSGARAVGKALRGVRP